MIPIVISGGSGTRLWPVSRAHYPKQFCQLFAEPLQSMTLRRCQKLGTPWVLTGQSLKTLTELSLKQLGLEKASVLYEPIGKNTGPAIAVLCQHLQQLGHGDQVVGIFPSDHLIRKQDVFEKVVGFAERLANEGYVVTLGITPTYAETGYGYIQATEPLKEWEGYSSYLVTKFHEKPSKEKAEEFLKQGGFSWNAGIFVFKVAKMIEHFQKHQAALWQTVSELKADLSNIEEIYKKLPSISLDFAIMEHLGPEQLACIPSEMGWNDVGSWDAVAAEVGEKKTGLAKVVQYQSESNFVFSAHDKKVALVGVSDLIVVETEDSLLISRKGSSQEVKKIVDELVKTDSSEAKVHRFEDRPWGRFEILRDTEQFKSKVIRVNPMSQISYQSHAQREEHWIVTEGDGEVVLNDEVIPVKKGSYIHIPLGAKHRIRNTSKKNLVFVEVQLGSYFGEDDIVRYQDDYKRQ